MQKSMDIYVVEECQFSEVHGPNVQVNPREASWTNNKHGGICVVDINLITGSSITLRVEGSGQFALGFIEASMLDCVNTDEEILQSGFGWKKYKFRNKTKTICIHRRSLSEAVFIVEREEIPRKFLRAVEEEDALMPVLDVHWGDVEISLDRTQDQVSSTSDIVQDQPKMKIVAKTSLQLSRDGRTVILLYPYPWCLCAINNPLPPTFRRLELLCQRSVDSSSAFIEVLMTTATIETLSNEVDRSLVQLCKFPVKHDSVLTIRDDFHSITYSFESDIKNESVKEIAQKVNFGFDDFLPLKICLRLFQTKAKILEWPTVQFQGGSCSPTIMKRAEPAADPPPLDRPRRRRAAPFRQTMGRERGGTNHDQPPTNVKFF